LIVFDYDVKNIILENKGYNYILINTIRCNSLLIYFYKGINKNDILFIIINSN